MYVIHNIIRTKAEMYLGPDGPPSSARPHTQLLRRNIRIASVAKARTVNNMTLKPKLPLSTLNTPPCGRTFMYTHDCYNLKSNQEPSYLAPVLIRNSIKRNNSEQKGI